MISATPWNCLCLCWCWCCCCCSRCRRRWCSCFWLSIAYINERASVNLPHAAGCKWAQADPRFSLSLGSFAASRPHLNLWSLIITNQMYANCARNAFTPLANQFNQIFCCCCSSCCRWRCCGVDEVTECELRVYPSVHTYLHAN